MPSSTIVCRWVRGWWRSSSASAARWWPAPTSHRIAPHPCSPVDATGAGDTFGGAFVSRLIAGDSLRQAAHYAAVAAALSTEGYGAVEPIPHSDRVLAALAHAGGGEPLSR